MNNNEIFKKLISEKPMFHGRANAGTEQYAITSDILNWINNNLQSDSVTLETGCGYSTIVFMLHSKKHYAISPFYQEHAEIEKWCRNNNLSTGNTKFIVSSSQEALPSIQLNDGLDMVLIDGDHAFPASFIDWYYTADRIKKSGILIVDDTQLTTGKILKEFLLEEKTRWTCIEETKKTSIFKKITSDPVAKGIYWIEQPYVKKERLDCK